MSMTIGSFSFSAALADRRADGKGGRLVECREDQRRLLLGDFGDVVG